MTATVVSIRDGSIVDVIVRRGCRRETLDGTWGDLKVGDKVKVRRVVNNPYLQRIV